MIRRRLGRRDWSEVRVDMSVGRTWRVVVVLLLLVPLAGACKKKGPGPGEGAGGAGAGLGEEGLTGSSLDRAKRGLGPEEDGILKDVHFGFDQYDLDSTANQVVSTNVGWLRQNTH